MHICADNYKSVGITKRSSSIILLLVYEDPQLGLVKFSELLHALRTHCAKIKMLNKMAFATLLNVLRKL